MEEPQHIVTVIVILKYRNQYLLVQRNKDDEIFPGKWQNLGGKVELGERLEEAIRREVEEEVGIRINKGKHPIFIQSYSWTKDKNSPMRMGIIFLLKLTKKPKRIELSDELSDYGWFTYKEIKKLDTIAKESETGTMGQLTFANRLNY